MLETQQGVSTGAAANPESVRARKNSRVVPAVVVQDLKILRVLTVSPGVHTRNTASARSVYSILSNILLPESPELGATVKGRRVIHSYRRAFFQSFPMFGNNDKNYPNWRYVSIYGDVLSLLVNFSRTKNIKFGNIPIFGKKQENMED